MPHLSKLLDMDKDVDMDEAEVEDVVAVEVVVDTILFIVVVLRVKRTTQTTRSGIIHRHNLKRGYNHKVNMLVRIIVIDVV